MQDSGNCGKPFVVELSRLGVDLLLLPRLLYCVNTQNIQDNNN